MTTIKLRRGTAAQWVTANPVLAAGEPGYDLTDQIFKIGDGTTHWLDLPTFDISDNIFAEVTAQMAATHAMPPTYATPRPGTYDSTQSIYRPRNSVLARTKAKLAVAAAGTGYFTIACIGESTVAGYPTTLNRATDGWPPQLAAMLDSAGFTSGGSGLVVGANNVDPRWTSVTGTGSDATYFATGSTAINGYTSAAKLGASGGKATFTSLNAGTVVDIVYELREASAQFTYSIDGATSGIGYGTVNASNANSTAPYFATVTVKGLPNSAHTVVLTSTSSSPVVISGAQVRGTSGVLLSNLGVGGTYTNWWLTDNSAAGGYSAQSLTKYLQPDLVIVGIGLNDNQSPLKGGSNVILPDGTQANLTTLVQRVQSWGSDVVLLNPTRMAPSRYGSYPQEDYFAAEYDAVDATSVPLVDCAEVLGPYDYTVSAGLLSSDLIHPTKAGYTLIAKALLQLLLS